jgi:hypothetical protein
VSQLLREIGMSYREGPAIEVGIGDDQLPGPVANFFGLDAA